MISTKVKITNLREDAVLQIDGTEDSYYIGNANAITGENGYTWISDSDMCLSRKSAIFPTLESAFGAALRVIGSQQLRGLKRDGEVLFEFKRNSCDEVMPGLFIGDASAAFAEKWDYIVNCTTNIKMAPCKEGLRLEWLDHPDQELHGLQTAIEKIAGWRTSGRVLVHCEQGVSRSAAVVIAYLCKTQNCNLETAMSALREKRGVINPNPGFLEQLGTRYSQAKMNSQTNVKLK